MMKSELYKQKIPSILIDLVSAKIVLRQTLNRGIKSVQNVATGQTRVGAGIALLDPHLIGIGIDGDNVSHVETHSGTDYRSKLFPNTPDGGGFRVLVGLHLLGEGSAALADVAVGQLLVRLDEELAMLAGDADEDNLDGANGRGGIGEGNFALGKFEPEVVDVLGAGLDAPGGEAIGGKTRFEPVGEGLRGGEAVAARRKGGVDVVVVVRDMAGILRRRRGKGQRLEATWGLEDDTKKHTERAVRRRSGREGRFVSGCGGGNISTAAIRRVLGAGDWEVHAGKL
ncbi:hypothetical protein CR513_51268, partial [Mucuna pruriens]